VFLVSNGVNCILVDTSVKNKWGVLNKKISKLCEEGVVLTSLILTHSHFDHAGNATSVKEKYDVKVIAHRNEADYLIKGKTSLPRGTILLTKWFDVFGEKATQLVKYEPVKCDVLIDDTYDLNEMGFNAYIMHTPGHSEGSISIIIDNEIAIVGDAMFGVLKGSVLPFFADNTKTMINSWKKLLDTRCLQFLPSHGTENSRELLQKQYNKYKLVYNI
jgi:glyoxylase-like metal-dependent hydrolase (beta-lactamase superfamily II)